MSKTIMLSAGEISGDAYGAQLADALQQQGARVIGMGQQKMFDAGVDMLIDSRDIAVMGLTEVLCKYFAIRRALKAMQVAVIEHKPDVLVCIDYKEFNFKLAKFAKQHGVKVVFYIAPTVWAWREKRIEKYKSIADLMAVIFPFEVPLWEDAGIPTIYTGNPLVEKVQVTTEEHAFCDAFGLDASKPIIGLLPGSRSSEIKRLMPLLLKTAEAILTERPEVQFILPYSSGMNLFNWGQRKNKANSFSQKLRSEGFNFTLKLVKDDFYNVINACDVAVCASGTASLEVALVGTPQVVTYKISPLSYFILNRMIKTPWVSLTNILLEREVVKEYLQDDATVENLSAETLRLLTQSDAQLNAYDELRQTLATEKTSDVVEAILQL